MILTFSMLYEDWQAGKEDNETTITFKKAGKVACRFVFNGNYVDGGRGNHANQYR